MSEPDSPRTQLPALIYATVRILLEVKRDTATDQIKEEIEAGLSACCSMLEQSSIRDTRGCVSYVFHKLKIEEV